MRPLQTRTVSPAWFLPWKSRPRSRQSQPTTLIQNPLSVRPNGRTSCRAITLCRRLAQSGGGGVKRSRASGGGGCILLNRTLITMRVLVPRDDHSVGLVPTEPEHMRTSAVVARDARGGLIESTSAPVEPITRRGHAMFSELRESTFIACDGRGNDVITSVI